jgi:hypothetical protein
MILIPLGIFWAFKRRTPLPFVSLGIWIFLMLLGRETPVFGWFWTLVPGMKYFRYSIHFLFFFELIGAVLSGFGLLLLGQLAEASRIGKRVSRDLVVWLCVGFGCIDLLAHQSSIVLTNQVSFWLEKPPILEKIQGTDWRNQRLSSFGLTDANNGEIENDRALQSSLRNFLPVNYNLVFGIPSQKIYTPLALQYQADLENYYSLEDSAYSDEINAQRTHKVADIALTLPSHSFRLEALSGTRYLITPIPLKESNLEEIANIDLTRSLTAVLIGTDGATGEFRNLPIVLDKVYLYQILEATTRAMVIGTAKVATNDDVALKYLFNDTFDARYELLINGIQKDEDSGAQGSAKVTRDSGEQVDISADASKDGWLYLADSYYPGWYADVDGKQTQIYRANYAFRAIRLPKGTHTVHFIYDPWSRKIGAAISSTTILSLGLFMMWRRKRNTKILPLYEVENGKPDD